MFNLTDFYTPFQQLINLYYIVLGPYIELLKYKFITIKNLLFKIEEDIPFSTFQRVKTNNNKTMLVDKVQDIIDLDDKDLLEDPSKTKSSYVKYFVLGCAVGIVLYIIFLTSSGTDPNVLADYNSINQFLINSKSSIKDSFISIYNQFIGDSLQDIKGKAKDYSLPTEVERVNSNGSIGTNCSQETIHPIEMTDLRTPLDPPHGLFTRRTRLPNVPVIVDNDVMTNTPTGSNIILPASSETDITGELSPLHPITSEASTQTILDAYTIGCLVEQNSLLKSILKPEERSLLDSAIMVLIKKITD